MQEKPPVVDLITGKDPVDIAVFAAGTAANLAAELGITEQAVSNWRSHGIPTGRCVEIYERWSVPLWLLRPGDWHKHWPMLAGTDGAPPLPAADAAH
jgi:hypothetical protein